MKIFIFCKDENKETEHTHIVRQVYICKECGAQNSGHGKRVEKVAAKRGRKPALTESDRQKAYRLHFLGISDVEIANRLQVSAPTVNRAWKELEAKNGR